VDNAGSGHARQAVDAVHRLMPSEPTARNAFYERLKRGFMLNDEGIGSATIAGRFDSDALVTETFRRKARYGRAAHADYCRIAGKTVNEWLSDAERIPDFLASLERTGWIKRHADPASSRFWPMLIGPGACMFGVFNAFELQLIYDWIAGDCSTYLPGPAIPGVITRPLMRGRHLSFRQMQRAQNNGQSDNGMTQAGDRTIVPIELLAPGAHHTPDGGDATKSFAQAFVGNAALKTRNLEAQGGNVL
jgi:hypothetical protein